MKYLIIESGKYDDFVEEYATKEEAISVADRKFASMCDNDKKNTSRFVVRESENPDEEAPNHYDGNDIKVYI